VCYCARLYRLDKVLRTSDSGKTMGELRDSQHGLFNVAVIWHDGTNEHIEYFDALDEEQRNNPAVVVYVLDRVLSNLYGRGFTKFHIFSDTCSNHFRSRLALNAVMVDLVDSLLERNLVIRSFSWSFFMQYHGKCICNGHFSAVKRALKHESQVNGSICGVEEISYIVDRKVSHTTTMVVPADIPGVQDVNAIKDIKQFYSFERVLTEKAVICKKFTKDSSGVKHVFCPKSSVIPASVDVLDEVNDSDLGDIASENNLDLRIVAQSVNSFLQSPEAVVVALDSLSDLTV